MGRWHAINRVVLCRILFVIPETAGCVGEVECEFLFRFLKPPAVVEVEFIAAAIIVYCVSLIVRLKRRVGCRIVIDIYRPIRMLISRIEAGGYTQRAQWRKSIIDADFYKLYFVAGNGRKCFIGMYNGVSRL